MGNVLKANFAGGIQSIVSQYVPADSEGYIHYNFNEGCTHLGLGDEQKRLIKRFDNLFADYRKKEENFRNLNTWFLAGANESMIDNYDVKDILGEGCFNGGKLIEEKAEQRLSELADEMVGKSKECKPALKDAYRGIRQSKPGNKKFLGELRQYYRNNRKIVRTARDVKWNALYGTTPKEIAGKGLKGLGIAVLGAALAGVTYIISKSFKTPENPNYQYVFNEKTKQIDVKPSSEIYGLKNAEQQVNVVNDSTTVAKNVLEQEESVVSVPQTEAEQISEPATQQPAAAKIAEKIQSKAETKEESLSTQQQQVQSELQQPQVVAAKTDNEEPIIKDGRRRIIPIPYVAGDTIRVQEIDKSHNSPWRIAEALLTSRNIQNGINKKPSGAQIVAAKNAIIELNNLHCKKLEDGSEDCYYVPIYKDQELKVPDFDQITGCELQQ